MDRLTRTFGNRRSGRATPGNLHGLLTAALVAVTVWGVQAAGASGALAQPAPSPALVPAGSGLAWGDNFSGQLGDGTNTSSDVPVDVDLPAGVTITAISGGEEHSLAVTSTGTVLAWGANFVGQLGDGTNTDSNVPVNVDLPAGTTITAVSAGGFHSLALTSTGTVLAWGYNLYGQLGDGTNNDSNVPVEVDLPAGVTITAIAAGRFHSLALTSTGTVLAWGNNSLGQLGDGTNNDSNVPVEVDLPAGVTITAIAAGDSHSYALTSAGAVLAWGNNTSGELGDGTNTNSNVPVNVDLPAGTTVTAIASGYYHGLALTATDAVLAWGLNSSGQLGDGSNTNSNVPVNVDVPAGTTVTAIAGGGFHSLALTSTWTVLAWGDNSVGQLGDGTNTNSNVPVNVDIPAGTTITAIEAGTYHSLAIAGPIPLSTVTLQVSPPDPRPNEEVTLTATVTCNAGTPTGTVTYLDNGTTLGTATLTGDPATAQLTTTLTPGTHTIRARYNGNTDCPTATSDPVTVTVTQATSTTRLTATPLNPQPDEPVTLTATVTCNAATPTGTVTYLDNGTTLGTATLTGDPATAQLTVTLRAGTHTIRARYNGNTDCASGESDPVTVTVTQATSTVALIVTPEHPRAGKPVTLTATVTCNAATPTGTVTYLDNGTTLGTATLTGDPATAQLTVTLRAGTHTIRARYNGNTGCASGESDPVTVTVRPSLPVTGAGLSTPLAIGALLLLTGAALLIATRRRRTRM